MIHKPQMMKKTNIHKIGRIKTKKEEILIEKMEEKFKKEGIWMYYELTKEQMKKCEKKL